MNDAAKDRENCLEEYKYLQVAIDKFDNREEKIGQWVLTLLSALTVGLYAKNLGLTPWDYWRASIFVTTIFACFALLARLPKRKAIKRVREVEAYLRGDGCFPQLANTLSGPDPQTFSLACAKFFAVYFGILLITGAIAYFA